MEVLEEVVMEAMEEVVMEVFVDMEALDEAMVSEDKNLSVN
jgi:hypothetical protein